jgi:phosphomevalonate kinase
VKARAPGKLVLSGAYSVLEGAPAIVSAVDRYVCCDSDRAALHPTPEVRAALPEGPVPDFDASALRVDDRKLGLGSSAAILVASLAAADPRSFETETSLRRAIADRALLAHQEAQGGGSGIDVAASTWGGTLIAKRRADATLELEHVALPEGLIVEVWASGVPASTAEFLSRVAQFRMRSPEEYASLLAELGAAASAAATALRRGQIPDLLRNIRAQSVGFGALGRAAGVPIITPEVQELAECAGPYPAAVLPSGAGGGDIVLWLSTAPSPNSFRARAEALGHRLIPLTLHARGVHRCAPEGSSPRGS